MDRIIEVQVRGNYLSKDNKVAGVQHEGNVTFLRITFDEAWNTYAKKVTWWDAKGQNPVDITLTTALLEDAARSTLVYLCPIPPEPLAEEGYCTFVIDGYSDGKRQRSLKDELEVKYAPFDDDAGEPVDPTPTQAEQLQAGIDAINETIHEAAVSAAAAKVSEDNAKASENAAKTSETNAKASENAAADSRAAAKKSETEAANSAEAAANSATAAADTEKQVELKVAAAKQEVKEAVAQQVSEAKEDVIEAVALQVSRAEQQANAAADSAGEAKISETNARGSAAAAAASRASAADSASAAKTSETNAKGSEEAARGYADSMDTEQLNARISAKGDNLYFDPDTELLYLTSGGEIIGDGIKVATSGGGGGGGSSNNAVLTLTNTTGWIYKAIAEGAACPISFSWASLEEGMATGSGVLRITVGGSTKQTSQVTQGEHTVDIGAYLSAGTNAVKVNITDVYGNSRTLSYSLTTVSLKLESSFDPLVAYSGAITFPYVPTAAATKTMHFLVDGTEAETETVVPSGRQQTWTIPAQSHGSHTFEVYFTAEVDGETVASNHLYYELICIEEGNTTPIITTSFRGSTAEQYESIAIPYVVYDPSNLTAAITLSDGASSTALSVDRTEHVWTYRPDTVGDLTLTISCGNAMKMIQLTVTESSIQIEAETSGLSLYLSSYGRSNNEENPATWSYGSTAATMTGFNFTSDGWVLDEDNITALRVAGDARVSIPTQLFATDFRTGGKTIEVEFATRNILNYDAEVISCYSGGRGLKITAQKALLQSEQSQISTQYKEDEHVRLSFVVEKRSENRLLLCYINGILSGALQYPADDDFSQAAPVGISIGSSECTTDVYCIRVYDNDLTRYQILDNWIADTQVLSDRIARYNHNDVFNEYGDIVLEQLPADLPYLVLQAPVLPQYKGNKLSCDGYYVDPNDGRNSFTFTGGQIDVQGTSSAGYARKNYKLKFKNGLTVNGEAATDYQLRSDSIPTDTFTFKADVASSEGANNVELARLYNDTCPVKTAPQQADSRVRQGIDGFPIVIFHDDGSGPKFIGKYNFNNDKGTPEVFGFAEGDESWEILNNTSDRVIWKNADFTGTDWQNDFEARYPEDSTDVTRLSALAEWLVSTDQSAVESADEKAARLQKFHDELANWFDVDALIYNYLFTELFLMVDNRAKNAFPTRYDADGKWIILPYDYDTAIGTNNEGALAFGYALEDTDTTASGANVYNGQDSVLWVNLRQAYGPEIMAMYQQLRSDGLISYEDTEARFEEHQSKWPAAIFNEDSYYKYLQPLIDDGSGAYLGMLQGSKAEQRKWWLYNRFRYMDSKYNAGDALKDFITLRGYAKGDITITPYADIYASVKYGSYLVQARALRGSSYTLACPLTTLNDTEIYVYSASQLSKVGDLSDLMVGYADFSMATKLQELKLGDSADTYSNGNLTQLYLGNNVLLKTLDVRNCPNLGNPEADENTTASVDLSGCTNIEEVYFDGTSIAGVNLPNGGNLKKLSLPATVTNLTIRNQPGITYFSVTGEDYSMITTLWLENAPIGVHPMTLLNAMPENSRVRMIGFEAGVANAGVILMMFDTLDTMRGLDEYGNNVDKPQMQGIIHVANITGEQLAALQGRYPGITIDYRHITSNLYFYDDTGATLLYTAAVADGGDGTYGGTTPTKASTAQFSYTFAGWSLTQGGSADSSALNAVTADRSVYAVFTATVRTYTVTWMNGSTILETDTNVPYGTIPTYNGDTPVDSTNGYTFNGWSPVVGPITGNTTYTAQFKNPYQYAEIEDSWAQIFAAINDGSYKTKYSIGNYKALDLGSQGVVNMQIVAMDADEKADGSGNAPITWVSEKLLATSYKMNSGNSNNAEGTGSIGGWEKTQMRSYLKETVLPLIQEEVRSHIVDVKKYSTGYDTSGAEVRNGETTDDVWIPSTREIYGYTTLETQGPTYNTVFNSADMRKKMKVNGSSQTEWWMRTAYDTNRFGYVTSIGTVNNNTAYDKYGVALGFCT